MSCALGGFRPGRLAGLAGSAGAIVCLYALGLITEEQVRPLIDTILLLGLAFLRAGVKAVG